jgi:hypothetical protein
MRSAMRTLEKRCEMGMAVLPLLSSLKRLNTLILARWVENALDVLVQGSHDANSKSFVACSIEERKGRRWRRKRRLFVKTAKQNPAEAGCAYLEMTLMNFDYGGTVNFFAIIIGN